LSNNYDSNAKYSDEDLDGGGLQTFVNESLKGVNEDLENKADNTVATTTENGLMSSTDKAKLDGVEDGAKNYIHPDNHPPSIITQDSNNRFVTDAQITTWDGKAVIGSTGSWTGLSLVNSWVAYGSTYESPSYRKDQFDKLKLKGVVKDGTTTSPTTIATLPSGNRPTADQTFIVLSNNGTSDIVGRVTIKSTGEIQFISGSNTLFSLDSIPEIYVS
jgi:hypothetical protein